MQDESEQSIGYSVYVFSLWETDLLVRHSSRYLRFYSATARSWNFNESDYSTKCSNLILLKTNSYFILPDLFIGDSDRFFNLMI